MLVRQIGSLSVVVAALGFAACGGDSHAPASVGSGGAGQASGGTAGSSAGQGGSAGSAGGGRGGSDAGTGGTNAGRGGSDAGTGGANSGSGGGSGEAGAAAGDGGSAGLGGGAGTSGAGAGGSATLADLEDTVSAFCAAAATCCSERGVATDLVDCESMYTMYQTALPSLSTGAITLDAAALARCRAAYANGPDQCNLNKVVAACEGVFIGHQGVDEPCIGGYDCDRSEAAMTCLITDTTGDMPTGVCRTVPHAGLDEPCNFSCRSGDNCSSTTFGGADASPLCFEDDGLFCAYVGPDSACLAIVPLGDPCDRFNVCGSDAYCDTTCKPLSDLGEPCSNGCRHQYQCGDGGNCVDPNWATESACMGYAPGP